MSERLLPVRVVWEGRRRENRKCSEGSREDERLAKVAIGESVSNEDLDQSRQRPFAARRLRGRGRERRSECLGCRRKIAKGDQLARLAQGFGRAHFLRPNG